MHTEDEENAELRSPKSIRKLLEEVVVDGDWVGVIPKVAGIELVEAVLEIVVGLARVVGGVEGAIVGVDGAEVGFV